MWRLLEAGLICLNFDELFDFAFSTMGCRIAAESPVKICEWALVPDVERIAGTKAEREPNDDSPQ